MLFDFAGFQLIAELLTCIFLFFFLQEINHAGAGGLWAELVSNRGHFEIGCFYSSAAKGYAYVIFSTLIFLLYLEFKNPLCLINVSDQSLIAVSGSFVSQI